MTRYQADLLPRLLWALIQTRSVNMKQVAAAVWGSAPLGSCYRRLQRFLSGTWSPSDYDHSSSGGRCGGAAGL